MISILEAEIGKKKQINNTVALLGALGGIMFLGEAINFTNIFEGNFLRDRLKLDEIVLDDPVMFNKHPYEDTDGDLLTNTLEIRFGSDPFSYDTDRDGISDFLDMFSYDEHVQLLRDLYAIEDINNLKYSELFEKLEPMDSNNDGIPNFLDDDVNGNKVLDGDEINEFIPSETFNLDDIEMVLERAQKRLDADNNHILDWTE